jgi:hypothetical protein
MAIACILRPTTRYPRTCRSQVKDLTRTYVYTKLSRSSQAIQNMAVSSTSSPLLLSLPYAWRFGESAVKATQHALTRLKKRGVYLG